MAHARTKQSALAHALAPILDDPAIVDEMVSLSRRGRPAVEAIGAKIAAFRPGLRDTEKQHVGRLVREKLAARGLKPMRSARVRSGNLFSWGAVYGPVAGEPTGSSVADAAPELPRKPAIDEWLKEVRAMIATLPNGLMSSDAFIAQRRRDSGE